MKTRIIFLTMALLIFSASYSFAFNFYITDGQGSLNIRDNTVFQLSETPYAYIHVPTTDTTYKGTYWKHESMAQWLDPGVLNNSAQDVWLKLNWGDGSGGTQAKLPGTWQVQGWYVGPGPQYSTATKSFTFAPEPISMALFLLGGSVLVGRRWRRRELKARHGVSY